MPLVIPENYVQAALPIEYGGGSLYGYVTIGLFDFDTALTPQETVDVWVQAFLDNVAAYIDGGCTIGPAIGTVQLTGGSYATFTGTVSGVGGRDDAVSTAPALSVIVRKVTGRIGRTGRGRMFLPWAAEQDEIGEDGAVNSVLVTNINAGFLAMAEDMTTAGVAPMLLHNVGVPGGDTPTPITGFITEATAGTQRRRQRR